MISDVEKLKRTGDTVGLIQLVKSCKLNTSEEAMACKVLSELGFKIIVYPEEGHYEGGTYYCIGSDSNSNCHAGCVNGDRCRVEGGRWIVDRPRKIDIIKN